MDIVRRNLSMLPDIDRECTAEAAFANQRIEPVVGEPPSRHVGEPASSLVGAAPSQRVGEPVSSLVGAAPARGVDEQPPSFVVEPPSGDGGEPRTSRRGGKRRGAGRKRSGVRRGGPHRRRPPLDPAHPVHVTLRMDRDRPDMRTRPVYHQVNRVLRAFLGRDDFRVVHLSIQQNHLHMLVEAADRTALSRNMKSFAIRMQRAVRARYGCTLFPHRYHAVQITSARQARHALAYVLNNWRRHRLDRDDRGRQSRAKLDALSSAIAFDGWRGYRFRVPPGYVPLSVSAPRTWLLAEGWRAHGLVDPFETPGPVA